MLSADLDTGRAQYYRWNGYLPPFEFLPQMLVAEAHARLRQKKVEAAAAVYNKVVERSPTSRVAPEAAYFAAVANFRTSENPEELENGWQKLGSFYPSSDWRLKQTMVEKFEQSEK